ncbi:hypothetical protein VN97_g11076 [Penicillium thymicola]|uniref:Uncharacterized protein n=1 Tax=Penicillium thymicola TaxID=293382 RepID=A0AAI9T8V8_PENTH|nr:hypothetical protein VN97_g11076 [Penicillium thymicola]
MLSIAMHYYYRAPGLHRILAEACEFEVERDSEKRGNRINGPQTTDYGTLVCHSRIRMFMMRLFILYMLRMIRPGIY